MKRVVRIKSDGGLHSKTMSEQPKFTIQGTRKKEQIKPKVSRNKNKKDKDGTNAIKARKKHRKINRAVFYFFKSCFFLRR